MKKRSKTRNNTIPLITMGVGLLLIIAAGAWLLSNTGREPATGGGGASTTSGIPFPEVPRVSLSDSKAAYDLGSAVFLDVRSPQQYAESHIPEAINIPLNELSGRLGELNPEDWIITYCT